MGFNVKAVWAFIRQKVINLGIHCDNVYTRVYVRICPVKQNKIVFISYHGGGYGDNPKYIAEVLRQQERKWDMVWLCKKLDEPLPEGIRRVKYGSNRALREIASAKYFIDNARSSPRPPKRKGQIYLQTWHGGMGFKESEGQVEEKLSAYYVAAAKRDGANCDGIISSCKWQTELFKEYYWLNEKTEILEYGLPRNDKLFDEASMRNTEAKVRKAMDLDDETKIVLYMPTFRDDHSTDGYKLDYPGVVAAFEKRFGGKFVMLVRLHPNVKNQDGFIPFGDSVINATHYPDAQELYMTADFLISDYSSSVFDFALLRRPVFLCALDLEHYLRTRGLTDVYEKCAFPKAYTSEALLRCIEEFSEDAYKRDFEKFLEYWQPFDQGDAAWRTVEWMLSK